MTITAQRWQQVRDIFDRAADLPSTEWDKAVVELAGDDAELRSEVLSLLGALSGEGDRLEHGATRELVDFTQTEPAGIRLGSYRLLREVAEAGWVRCTKRSAMTTNSTSESRVVAHLRTAWTGDGDEPDACDPAPAHNDASGEIQRWPSGECTNIDTAGRREIY